MARDDREAETSDYRQALIALVEQVERSNALDDHGHRLSQNKALLDAKHILQQ